MIDYYISPLGTIEISSDGEAITGLNFIDIGNDEKIEEKNEDSLLIEAKKQLDEYFSKERKLFDLPISFSGTDFQERVWQELLKIPYGETISYAELAKRVNSPRAFRAVGSANGKNPISIIIPCHRVINSDGKLGGYASGLENKIFLLDLES